jgi:hypothetical protein
VEVHSKDGVERQDAKVNVTNGLGILTGLKERSKAGVAVRLEVAENPLRNACGPFGDRLAVTSWMTSAAGRLYAQI